MPAIPFRSLRPTPEAPGTHGADFDHVRRRPRSRKFPSSRMDRHHGRTRQPIDQAVRRPGMDCRARRVPRVGSRRLDLRSGYPHRRRFPVVGSLIGGSSDELIAFESEERDWRRPRGCRSSGPSARERTSASSSTSREPHRRSTPRASSWTTRSARCFRSSWPVSRRLWPRGRRGSRPTTQTKAYEGRISACRREPRAGLRTGGRVRTVCAGSAGRRGSSTGRPRRRRRTQ